MAKIAFLVGSFHPYYSANGICVKRLCDEFILQGHSVTVFSRRSYKQSSKKIIDGINIQSFKSKNIDTLGDMILMTRKGLFKFFLIFLSKSLYLLNAFLTMLFFPKISHKYSKNIIDIIDKYLEQNTIDIFVSVYTPIESVVAAKYIHEKYGQKIVLYTLDSINGGYVSRIIGKRRAEKRMFIFEQSMFKSFHKILLLNSQKHVYSTEKYSVFKEKFVYVDIPLVTFKIEKPLNLVKKEIDIVYTGTLQKGIKDPSRALEILNSTNIKNINVHFYGNTTNIKLYPERYDNLSIFIHKHVEYDQINGILQKSDFLLNIGSLNKNQIPSKIFEYISFGKPIISTFFINEEPSLPYLSKYKNVFLLDEKIKAEEIIGQLDEFIAHYQNREIDDIDDLKKKFITNTPKYFVDLILNI